MPTTKYQGDYFAIRTNEQGTEVVVADDEVLIVPLIEGSDVLLTREPSAAFGGQTLIIPGGTCEPDETFDQTAQRELQEEVGYKAGQLDFLGELRPFSKYLTVRSFVFLARDLALSRLPGDEDYVIGVEQIPLTSFEQLIIEGRLLDARVIAALYLARHFLNRRRRESS